MVQAALEQGRADVAQRTLDAADVPGSHQERVRRRRGSSIAEPAGQDDERRVGANATPVMIGRAAWIERHGLSGSAGASAMAKLFHRSLTIHPLRPIMARDGQGELVVASPGADLHTPRRRP